MDNKLEIKINNTPCVLFFGMATFRAMATSWGLPGLTAVLQKIATLGESAQDLSFESLDFLTEIIQISLKNNPEKQPEFTNDEILDNLTNYKLTIKIVNKITSVLTADDVDNNTDNLGKKVQKK